MDNIIIEKGCFKKQIDLINPKLILCDINVKLPEIKFPIHYIQTSEEEKTFDLYFKIINILNDNNLRRTDKIIIVGGGVLIDVASFAASTFKRGISYVNVPTTTLSMIDSSVGGKNGVNYNGVKNLIGNISKPSKIIIDIDFLETLDIRNYNNGIAEAIKIGFLSNQKILDELAKDNYQIQDVIKLSIEEKLKYVKADTNDFSVRNQLNFGHTFGHALETATGLKRFYHGEAISIGMVIESGYNQELKNILNKFELPTELPIDIDIDALIKNMEKDKKNTSDKIKFILKNPNLNVCELDKNQIKSLIDTKLTIGKEFKVKSVRVNKSKSHIHRLLAYTLATKSKLSFEFDKKNDLSDDVLQSLNILKDSGVKIAIENDNIFLDATIPKKSDKAYTVYKSATTYRIFTPILCSLFGDVEIILDEQLKNRPHYPFKPYINGNTHNLNFNKSEYEIDGSISSQFVSGYIFALVAQKKNAKIIIQNCVTSIPYIDMTINVLNDMGISVKRKNNIIYISNDFKLKTKSMIKVEDDFSSLAYFIVYNKLTDIYGNKNKIELPVIDYKSMQADSCINDILDNEAVNLENCPDLLPTLVVYGLLNKKGIKLTNIDRIKFKECDRIAVMIENFKDLDAITIKGDALIVEPVSNISSRLIKCYGDHRIAMACSIVAPFCRGDITIDDYTVVNKSFPTFFMQIKGE